MEQSPQLDKFVDNGKKSGSDTPRTRSGDPKHHHDAQQATRKNPSNLVKYVDSKSTQW
jgi:hypothetical protein